MNWLKPNTIYLTVHGSQAYGLNNELSDVDVKGICIPPREVEDDLFHRFEQAENPKWVEEDYSHLKNPKNPKFEGSIYSLRKFFLLAAKVNPNIIELLFTDPKDQFLRTPVMEKLLARRQTFLSTRAKFTFTGYAVAQAKKIERHRKWIVQGELQLPKREDFGLPVAVAPCTDEVFGYIKSKVETWNMSSFGLDQETQQDLKETIWGLVGELCNKDVDWDNWPDAYAEGAVHQMASELNLSEAVVRLIHAERAYSKARKNYDSWLKWKAERNPARRELEVRSGYDTKHASHLVRLMRMGREIIEKGQVIVKRPDAEEILAIKNGAWSYEKVMEFSEQAQKDLDSIYKQVDADRKAGKQVPLPREVDYKTLNDFYHELVEDYLSA